MELTRQTNQNTKNQQNKIKYMSNQISFVKDRERYFVEEQGDYLTIYTYYWGKRLSSVAMEMDKVEWIKQVLRGEIVDESSLFVYQYAKGWIDSAISYIDRQKRHPRFLNYENRIS